MQSCEFIDVESIDRRSHPTRADSCRRLAGALEELEQSLCTLTGDEYRHDEPLLHARAHLAQKLEMLPTA